ncbi:hypothetical protein F5Y18DRAFT_434448 [Xylariaceae sp. FL1019]|nr:hypothetical protein F5Y18DRAFT_434448 [Xylariaceae sp. FL1019]
MADHGIQDILQRYFAKDGRRRFELENFIAAGVEGQTWKVKYAPRGLPPTNVPGAAAATPQQLPIRRLALKIDGKKLDRLAKDLEKSGPVNQDINEGLDPDAMDIDDPEDDHAPAPDNEDDSGDEVEDDDFFGRDEGDAQLMGLAKERKVLNSWRWAMHVVNAFRPKDDPLTKKHHELLPLNFTAKDWIYMEYLENGTLERFLERAKRDETITGPMLPNRLLWKIFLCLVRICCAQLYPPKRPPGNHPRLVPETWRSARLIRGGIDHGDTHAGNIVFGDLTAADDEHYLVPILKLIDMGLAELILPNNNATHREREKDFVFTAAEFVYLLIRRNLQAFGSMPRPNDEGDHGYVSVVVRPGGPEIQSCAWGVAEDEFPNLDPDLWRLVCACLAVEPKRRPDLRELLRVVKEGATNRTEQYYQNLGINGESDANIERIFSVLMFNPWTNVAARARRGLGPPDAESDGDKWDG